MAKKKNKNNRLIKFFSDERLKSSLGIFFILFSLYLLLILISFLFTWKADQSFDWSKVFSGPEMQVENWGGKLGAYLANILINRWFGIASFGFPCIFLVIGFLFLNIRILPLGKTLRTGLIGIIIFSAIFGFILGDANGYLGSGPGGNHGYFISKWLSSVLGTTGTAFFLIVIFSAFAFFSFSKSLIWLKSLFRARDKDATAAEDMKFDDLDQATDTDQTDPEGVTVSLEESNNADPTEIPDESEMLEGDEGYPDGEEDDGVELTIEQKRENDTIDGPIDPAQLEDFDPTLELSRFKFPGLDLLDEHLTDNSEVSKDELISNKNRIVETLENYKIKIEKIKATIGPTVTLYEIVPAPGVRISKIKNLEDDIALSLAALGIRIIAPIPGRGTIGIEVPNRKPEIVSMRSMISSRAFQDTDFELALALGKTISNETYVVDLTKMPHLLIAGATGQGKSVGLNAIIASMLYKKHPAQVKFVMIDPKKVELSVYNKIEKHYLAKLPDAEEAIITDTQQVIKTLHSLTIEMEDRYNLLQSGQERNIKGYNDKFISRKLNPKEGHRYLPYIVVIIDEFADLIMMAGREVEMPLARLAQKARAIGIHLIIATQRPSINIITGPIKANFPARLAFRVISMMDSRTILDRPGANQLVGRGDMLISTGSDMIRLQCPFIDIPEIDRIAEHISKQQSYPSALILPEVIDDSTIDIDSLDPYARDDLFEDAARLIVESQQGSTSLIQRKFSIGYNRAGRIIDQMESAGIVGSYEGSKARKVLIKDLFSLEQILNSNTED